MTDIRKIESRNNICLGCHQEQATDHRALAAMGLKVPLCSKCAIKFDTSPTDNVFVVNEGGMMGRIWWNSKDHHTASYDRIERKHPGAEDWKEMRDEQRKNASLLPRRERPRSWLPSATTFRPRTTTETPWRLRRQPVHDRRRGPRGN